jgi:hypothetical protein
VLFGRFTRGKRAEVSALSCFWVYLSGIKAVLAGLELADHDVFPPYDLARLDIEKQSKWRTKRASPVEHESR